MQIGVQSNKSMWKFEKVPYWNLQHTEQWVDVKGRHVLGGI